MSDDWRDHDFNSGEEDDQIPPPPGADDDYYETFDNETTSEDEYPIPAEPNFPTQDGMYPGQLTEDQWLAWKYLVEIDAVQPSQIRGIAFASLYETVGWLQEIGLLGFSKVVFSGGFYYPAIGESDEINAADDQGDATDWDFDPVNY